MSSGAELDGLLVQWGERLFYPGNRIVRSGPTPNLSKLVARRAAAIRRHIGATIRRAPQVMVKVTGGGQGMGAIAAHFRYISRNGRLELEDDRGFTRQGKDALHDLAEQWQYGGSYIGETSLRREAFNIMLSMPQGTDALTVQRAAREFAQAELKDHRYVMALHDDQANPHVHISVRAESTEGRRLNPRKADLQRWRETFADRLRGWGIDAEATRQATRGVARNYASIWRVKAREDKRLRKDRKPERSGEGFEKSQAFAQEAWDRIIAGLAQSNHADDRALADRAAQFVRSTGLAVEHRIEPQPGIEQEPVRRGPEVARVPTVSRDDPGRGR